MIAGLLLAAGLGGSGTGIQGNNVCLSSPAQQGQPYPLDVYVQDTGSDAETISVTESPLSPAEQVYRGELPVPSSWMPGVSVPLAPGQGADAHLTLTIPGSAQDGIYVANIYAVGGTAAPSGGGIQAALGSGGQAYLIFRVGPGIQPSCTLPPPAGSPSAALYSRKEPHGMSISMAWLHKHEPWYFTHGKSPAAASSSQVHTTAQAGSPVRVPRIPVPPAGGIAAAVVAALALTAVASRRRRGGSQ